MRTGTLPALLLVAALAACAPPGETPGTLQLDRLQGRWVVINYWATWCRPCIREIPELNALAARYPETITVLGVNYDGVQGDELAQQVSELGIAFEVLVEDPAGRLGVPRPQVLPTTLVLDPAGRLVDTLVGPQTLDSLARATGAPATDG